MHAKTRTFRIVYTIAVVWLITCFVPFDFYMNHSRLFAQIGSPNLPLTIAEASQFRDVPSRQQLRQYLMLLDSAWDNAQVQFLGKSLDGHAIEALVVGDLPDPDSGEQERPLCVFVVGGMHPTEAIASQAALAVVRDLLRDESNGWLKSLRLVMLPSLNPDQHIILQQPAKGEGPICLESQTPGDGYRYSP
ncbi:MAG TPA: hypothetical protein DCF63_00595 [Planctomycetaceae bacterium]|nr:hypothetical protein [Planctomycetaceae bacterium]